MTGDDGGWWGMLNHHDIMVLNSIESWFIIPHHHWESITSHVVHDLEGLIPYCHFNHLKQTIYILGRFAKSFLLSTFFFWQAVQDGSYCTRWKRRHWEHWKPIRRCSRAWRVGSNQSRGVLSQNEVGVTNSYHGLLMLGSLMITIPSNGIKTNQAEANPRLVTWKLMSNWSRHWWVS